MKKIIEIIPNHAIVLVKRLGIAVLMLFITRLLFVLFNSNAFVDISIYDFVLGLWFDLITVGLFFFPFYTLFLLPLPIRGYKFHRIFFKIIFHATNTLLIALNLLDIEYFTYTSKRSTFDLFSLVSTGNDVGQLASTFVSDFWHLFLFLIILIVLSEILYRKTTRSFETVKTKPKLFYRKNILAFAIILPILIVISRGGFALKPTGIIEASNFTKGKNTSLVLTTPFTMIKTIDQGDLELVNYFDDSELENYFSAKKTTQPQNILPDNTNVMIIILESFGIEFIGAYQDGEGYTPFLDSLIDQSITYNYGFANGKKSIEAIPAIIASMPTLMDNPYISSPFGDNKINTLPNILAKNGYQSAFYHGATNGSMRFDGFAHLTGFDHYFGRTEYNNEKHSDMTWGILDEYFNPWTARMMSDLKEPFFSTLFTLSSHHPYFIPEHMRDKVKRGPQELCASINYGDYALKEFFEEAKKQPWYDNTLFVVLADHTPGSKTKKYSIRTQMYRVPILFYHPKGFLKAERKDEIIQQLDIMPTILDLLNIKTDYYAFGNSAYQNTDKESLAYISGSYFYFKNKRMTTIIDGKARFLHDFTSQDLSPIDSLSYYKEEVKVNENRVKAMIQTYNRDLNLNKTTIE
tara:strand:- start:1281 stop:3182 length:1902 start_codon:yes stop_codon:yes gene_type:complete